MAIPVIRTKVMVPRRSGLLSRQRLIDLMYDLLDYKLIIVAAPAGYGKTALLVDMAHELEIPVCWLAIDELDRDPQRFIAHFIAALAQRFPGVERYSKATLEAQSTAGGELDLDQVVATLVNELYEHAGEHFVIILDDYHWVDEIEEINYFIDQFLQYVDENCHMVISSRSLLPLPSLPLMVARRQVGGLSFEELAFRPDEIQAWFLHTYRHALSDEEAEELARQTEGWITGILLSAKTLQEKGFDRAATVRAAGVGLYDYLAQQVLDRQPPAVRDFLLRTSLLEEFDAQRCLEVLGPSTYPTGETWEDLVQLVMRENLFVLPVGEEGTWLRYHPLFREFLQNRLATEQPDEYMRILYRLKEYYIRQEAWEEAYKAIKRLEDIEELAALIEQAGSALIRSGRIRLLAEWLNQLPQKLIRARPMLMSLQGTVAYMQGDLDRGLHQLEEAVTLLQSEGADRNALALTLLRRAVACRFQGNYRAAIEDAEKALLSIQNEPETEQILHLKAFALREKGINLFHLGKSQQALLFLDQSLELCEQTGDYLNAAKPLLEIGVAYLSTGRFLAAETCFQKALIYNEEIQNLIEQIVVFNNIGVLHHKLGHYTKAVSALEKALRLIEQTRYLRLKGYVLCSLGDILAEIPAFDAAREIYQRARHVATTIQDKFLLLYVDITEADLLRKSGDFAHAFALLDRSRPSPDSQPFEYALWSLEAGKLAFAEAKWREAVEHFRRAATAFEAGERRVEAFQAFMYLAAALHAQKDTTGSRDCVQRALDLADQVESPHPLAMAVRELRPFVETLRRDLEFGPRFTPLLEELDRFEQRLPAIRKTLRDHTTVVAPPPPRLVIRALGHATVRRGGRLITTSDWQTQTARDLFFCVLAHQDGLTKEAIGELLWPEAGLRRIKLRFKNTLYRVRRAVGSDAIVFDGERYFFNRDLDYEYDVERFQELLKRAQQATTSSERISALTAAVELYDGPFLPEVEGVWVWPLRERFRQMFLSAVLDLARHHLTAGHLSAALEWCQRALAEDPCLEEAHRLAMRVYAAMGNRAAVVRQFELCRQNLLQEVNVPPSPQTEDLLRALTR